MILRHIRAHALIELWYYCNEGHLGLDGLGVAS